MQSKKKSMAVSELSCRMALVVIEWLIFSPTFQPDSDPQLPQSRPFCSCRTHLERTLQEVTSQAESFMPDISSYIQNSVKSGHASHTISVPSSVNPQPHTQATFGQDITRSILHSSYLPNTIYRLTTGVKILSGGK